jgi:Ca2+-binding RTX toxin-like protein
MASRWRTFELALLLSATATVACAAGASAATIAVKDGTAVFRAAHGEANDLSISIRAPSLPCAGVGVGVVSTCVSDAGVPLTVGVGCEQLGPNLAACPEDIQDPRRGRPVLVFGRDGDDGLFEESEIRDVTLRGGSGDDALQSGSGLGKSPALYGGQGDDALYVFNNGAGTPIMRGGPGDDELCSCENGGGLLDGNAGDDRLFMASNGTSALSLSLDGGRGSDTYVARGSVLVGLAGVAPGPGADVLDASGLSRGSSIDLRSCHGCVEWVTGSPGDDEITGYAGRQVLLGGEGLDVIRGLRGPDLLAGQDGDDTIYSRDDSVDAVGCGAGVDTVLADASDAVSSNCETVMRRRGHA